MHINLFLHWQIWKMLMDFPPFSQCTKRTVSIHLMSSYSVACLFPSCFMHDHIYCTLVKSCSEDRTSNFLMNFSMVLIPKISECFNNIDRFIFLTLMCEAGLNPHLQWKTKTYSFSSIPHHSPVPASSQTTAVIPLPLYNWLFFIPLISANYSCTIPGHRTSLLSCQTQHGL